MSRQSELLQESMRHMPEGVAENYRFWGPDRTVFIQRAKGTAPSFWVMATSELTVR